VYCNGLPAPQCSTAGADTATPTATPIVSSGFDQMESVPTVLATSDANEWY